MHYTKIHIIVIFIYFFIIIPHKLQGSENLSHGDGLAEGTVQTISFHFDQVLLKDALEYLIENYDIPLAYQEEQIKNVKISAKCEKCEIEDALDSILYKTGFSWKKVGIQYIIIESKEYNLQYKKGKNIIRGFIKDERNAETIPYANIFFENTPLGTSSSEEGYYIITKIPDGNYKIKVMMMGYGQQEKSIQISGGVTATIDFYLKEEAIQGETIVKTAESERFAYEIEASKLRISRQEIEAVPAFIESDLFRSIQMLPGVVTQSDFSSALYIRGGNPSENLILLDDVRIYNPYHLGGVFSTFNTDAIKDVDIYLGGFSSSYGNACSSVISVTNKDGNSKEFEGNGTISLLSSKLTLEGPIPRGSFLLSARRTYFDFLYNTFFSKNSQDMVPYYFYDYHTKINFALSPSSKITLSGFYGDDILNSEEEVKKYDNISQSDKIVGKDKTDIRFGNFCYKIKWQYILGSKLFSEFILSKSRFRAKFEGDYVDDDENLNANDIINDYSLNSNLTYFISGNHELKFGLDYQYYIFKMLLHVSDVTLTDYSRYANFYSTYIQDNWKVTEQLSIQSGLRFTYYNLGKYFRLDPRLSVRYRLRPNINLKASVGLFHQYFYTFNPEDIDFLNLIRLIDLWFPIDQRYKPIRAIHYIAACEYLISDRYMFSLEGYYKNYNHLLDLNEIGDKGQNDDFLRGWGNAMGIEFLLRKQKGMFTGWIAYAFSKTQKTIEIPRPSYFLKDINSQKEYKTYYPNYDRRHSLTLVTNYNPNDKWKLGMRYTYCSGLPETPTIGWKKEYQLGDYSNDVSGEIVPVRAAKNSYRLPPYVRLDISIMRNYQYKKWSLQPYLQIINVTNHKNIFLYNYDLDRRDDEGNLLPPRRQGVTMFPLIPTFGVNIKF
jgi:hypothetical protein